MSAELKKAIDQISKDRGIDREMLVDTLEEAVRSSVARKFGDAIDVDVEFDETTGEMQVYQYKVVVDEVEDEDTEISLEEARKLDPNAQLDDDLGFRIKVEDMGRIAAQSAKQVIIQRMRDAEQEIIYEEFKDRVGEIVSGIVQRRDRMGLIINLGRTEAVMPREEQVQKERYKRGDRIQAYIVEVLKEGRGPQVIVSRSHPDYMATLFKREVPEVADGTVRIMGVARDPGMRAKVAVMSTDRDVDPVGACVGIRGSRIQNVVQEFRGERIDIVVWKPDVADYARNAMNPAMISRIAVDDEERLLEVVVPDDQLQLAIGKKGQNVKLASKLLGWKIDIYTESRYGEAHASAQAMEQVAGVAEISVNRFYEAGFNAPEELYVATDEQLAAVEGLEEEKIGDIRATLNFLGISAPATEEEAEAEAETSAEASAEETPESQESAGAKEAGAEESGAEDKAATDTSETPDSGEKE